MSTIFSSSSLSSSSEEAGILRAQLLRRPGLGGVLGIVLIVVVVLWLMGR